MPINIPCSHMLKLVLLLSSEQLLIVSFLAMSLLFICTVSSLLCYNYRIPLVKEMNRLNPSLL